MRFLVHVLLALLVSSGGPAIAQEAAPASSRDSAPSVDAELRTLDGTFAELCRTGVDRLDDAAWTSWKRREALLAAMDEPARSRWSSRLTPECRTRLAELARQRAVAALKEWHSHGHRDGPIARIDRGETEVIARVDPFPPTAPTFGGSARPPTPTPPDAPRSPETLKSLFPWPPPTPSTRRSFSPDVVDGRPAVGKAGEVADRLTGLLGAARYDAWGFYEVPNGFALVTRMEALDPGTGVPLAGDARWGTWEPYARLSIADIFALTRARGVYRIFAFVLTDQPVETHVASPDQTFEVAQRWAVQGADTLPADIRERPVGPGHTLLVMVYEFEKSGAGDTKHFLPSRWTLDRHLASIQVALKARP